MKTRPQKGFTLIELLIVITLIAISVGVTSDVLVTLVRSYNKTNTINEIEQQSNFIGLKLEKELRNASNVISSDSNHLTFDTGGYTAYYVYVPANHNLYRRVGAAPDTSVSTYALVGTPSVNQTVGGVNVDCDGSCFTLTGAHPQIVGLSLVFSQAGTVATSFSGKVYLKNTIVIRNSY